MKKEENFNGDMQENNDLYIDVKTAGGIERVKLVRPSEVISFNKESNECIENSLNPSFLGILKDELMPDHVDVLLNRDSFSD